MIFTAIFSAVSIVWDREFGFLREMLVAPMSRPALLIGKILGGATVATLQGTLMLAFAGAVHVPYDPVLLLTLVGEMVLAAIVITSIGVLLASSITQMEAFQAVLQFVAMPMFFLSGAMFPSSGLPTWLAVLTRVDPLTYAVDPMRRAVFAHLTVPPAVRAQLAPGVTWGSWTLGKAGRHRRSACGHWLASGIDGCQHRRVSKEELPARQRGDAACCSSLVRELLSETDAAALAPAAVVA